MASSSQADELYDSHHGSWTGGSDIQLHRLPGKPNSFKSMNDDGRIKDKLSCLFSTLEFINSTEADNMIKAERKVDFDRVRFGL